LFITYRRKKFRLVFTFNHTLYSIITDILDNYCCSYLGEKKIIYAGKGKRLIEINCAIDPSLFNDLLEDLHEHTKEKEYDVRLYYDC
jgi:hypothetical protein